MSLDLLEQKRMKSFVIYLTEYKKYKIINLKVNNFQVGNWSDFSERFICGKRKRTC